MGGKKKTPPKSKATLSGELSKLKEHYVVLISPRDSDEAKIRWILVALRKKHLSALPPAVILELIAKTKHLLAEET